MHSESQGCSRERGGCRFVLVRCIFIVHGRLKMSVLIHHLSWNKIIANFSLPSINSVQIFCSIWPRDARLRRRHDWQLTDSTGKNKLSPVKAMSLQYNKSSFRRNLIHPSLGLCQHVSTIPDSPVRHCTVNEYIRCILAVALSSSPPSVFIRFDFCLSCIVCDDEYHC